jgi:threonine/homoserine/homoserine lactone efflux protein
MASWETLASFILALGVFAYLPGPAIVYTAVQTLSRGRKCGFIAVAGLHIGGLVHIITTVLGLSAILLYVPVAYAVVKFAGAAYLVWLGIKMILSYSQTSQRPELSQKTSRHAFLESIAVEVLNPKAALFFLAFLPQFVDPVAYLPVPVQLLILGYITNLAFTSADILTVLLSSTVAGRANKNGYMQRAMRAIGGSLLIGLGLKLAVESDQ